MKSLVFVAASASILFAVNAASADPARPYGALEAGGLTPPPPMDAVVAKSPNATEQTLDQAKRDDSGRGLSWVAIEGDGGFEERGLQALHAGDAALAAGITKGSASGGYVGGGVALRLLYFTIGGRARAALLGSARELAFGGELGAHLPFGRVEPSLGLGAGYATVGALKSTNGADVAGVNFNGFYARGTAGLDYYFVPAFSAGLRFGADLTALSRGALDAATAQKLTASAAVTSAQATALASPGSSLGGAIDAGATVALHF